MMFRVVPLAFSLAFVVFACSPGAKNTDEDGSGGDGGDGGAGPDASGGDRQPEAGSDGSGGSGDSEQDQEPGAGGMGGNIGMGGTMGGMAGTSVMGGTAGQATGGQAPVSQCTSSPICDDFEGLAEGPYSKGSLVIDGGIQSNYMVTAAQKHSGQRSIKIEAGGPSGTKRFLRAGVGDKLGDGKAVFARVWMFFPQLPKLSRSDGTAHYRLIRSFELIPPNVGTSVSAGIVGSNRGRLLYFKPAGFKDCAADGGTLPANKWTCVELRSDNNSYEAWIDGQSIGARATVSGDNCWQKRDKVANMSFGFEIAAGVLDEPFSFYMDDIALDTKRIGCN